ncbi:hypothetical protein WG66_015358 [Moniliophthora roreri]|nr:hypothetical protein WG66_015358 [Moniliophthora roreri]
MTHEYIKRDSVQLVVSNAFFPQHLKSISTRIRPPTIYVGLEWIEDLETVQLLENKAGSSIEGNVWLYKYIRSNSDCN